MMPPVICRPSDMRPVTEAAKPMLTAAMLLLVNGS